MGCAWSVLYAAEAGVQTAQLVPGIQTILERVVAQMSNWEPESLLSVFNRATPGTWLALPEEFALVLACAVHVASVSEGALDPTASPLVQLWGFGPGAAHRQAGFAKPSAEAVLRMRQQCGWQRLQVDTHAMRLHQPGGLVLDLSAVAKGFAVDEISRYLRRAGVAHHLVDIGGELRGAGMKPDGQPWWVDVQQPPEYSGTLRTRVALHGLAVATSGDYLQQYSENGRLYSHCIDPRSGYPVDNGVSSVTVLHKECMLADAWSTAMMVLGPESGALIAEREQLAVQWLVRAPNGIVEHCSPAFLAMVAESSS